MSWRNPGLCVSYCCRIPNLDLFPACWTARCNEAAWLAGFFPVYLVKISFPFRVILKTYSSFAWTNYDFAPPLKEEGTLNPPPPLREISDFLLGLSHHVTIYSVFPSRLLCFQRNYDNPAFHDDVILVSWMPDTFRSDVARFMPR